MKKSLALLIFSVLLVDLPLIGGGFVWDDELLIAKNTLISDLSNLPRFFQIDLWSSVDAPGLGGTPYYRPMVLVDLAIDYAISGLSPIAYRLHSLLWHLVCAGLCWRWLRGFAEDSRAAAVAAAIFALHPLHLEVAAFASARNDAMAAAGVLGALILLEPARVGAGRLIGAAALALFALFSKESAALLPLLLLGADLARSRRPGHGARYLALLGALGLYALSRAQAALPGIDAPADVWSILPETLAFYLGQLLRPWRYEPVVYLGAFPPPWWALSGLALLAAAATYGGRVAWFGLFFSALTAAPAAFGVAWSDQCPHRYAYAPLIGLALTSYAVLLRAGPRAWRLGAAAAAGLAVCSALVAPVWANTRAFWTYNYELRPGPQAACPLFVEYALAGESAAAEPLLRAALAEPVHPHCCLWFSRFYLEQDRPDLSIFAGERALNLGCAPEPELISPMALSEALRGDWERASTLATSLERDPHGYRAVILAADALRRGDEPAFAELAGPDPSAAGALRERAEWLLSQPPPNAPHPE